MATIKTFNNIAKKGLAVLTDAGHEVDADAKEPEGVILRSHNLHDENLPDSVLAIGRAGAGVNNIPIEEMSKRGVVVFNAPGANANAVKELVIAGLLMAYRNIVAASNYAHSLTTKGDDLKKEVEAGKKQFAGTELRGKTLGVIGLGAIGIEVALAANALGMQVVGFDPHLTDEDKEHLASDIEVSEDLGEVFKRVNAVTVHVPLIDATKGIIGKDGLDQAQDGLVVMNFSRGGVVDDEAILAALKSGKVARYVTDFPTEDLLSVENVIALPHLGASTAEAEDNSATMAAKQLADYLENGNIVNSVNYPNAELPRKGTQRLAILHKNAPGILAQITECLGEKKVNITHVVNECRGDVAYTLLDADSDVSKEVVDAIENGEGVTRVRVL